MAPRRRTRRGSRSLMPRVPSINYSFSIRLKTVNKTSVTWGSLGVLADFILRAQRVTIDAVSTGTCSLQMQLFGVAEGSGTPDQVALSRPRSVGTTPVRLTVTAPPGTDYNQPANDEAAVGFILSNKDTADTSVLITGTLTANIRSPSVMVVLAG